MIGLAPSAWLPPGNAGLVMRIHDGRSRLLAAARPTVVCAIFAGVMLNCAAAGSAVQAATSADEMQETHVSLPSPGDARSQREQSQHRRQNIAGHKGTGDVADAHAPINAHAGVQQPVKGRHRQ